MYTMLYVDYISVKLREKQVKEKTKRHWVKLLPAYVINSCIEIYFLYQIPKEKMVMVNVTSGQWEAQREIIQEEELQVKETTNEMLFTKIEF